MVRALTVSLSLILAAPVQSQIGCPTMVRAGTEIYDEFAAAILAAGTREESAALLAARPELVTAELSRARRTEADNGVCSPSTACAIRYPSLLMEPRTWN